MDAELKQKEINDLFYWDTRVLKISCESFSDDVYIVYGDEEEKVEYHFIECYKANFNHSINYKKIMPSKNLKISQIYYFIQNVEIGEIEWEHGRLYTCKIDMFPLEIEIWCRDILVTKCNIQADC